MILYLRIFRIFQWVQKADTATGKQHQVLRQDEVQSLYMYVRNDNLQQQAYTYICSGLHIYKDGSLQLTYLIL